MNRLIFVFILICQISVAQEFVKPLMYNSQIPQSSPRSAFESNAPIDLPFYDDFSDYLVYPKVLHIG